MANLVKKPLFNDEVCITKLNMNEEKKELTHQSREERSFRMALFF